MNVSPPPNVSTLVSMISFTCPMSHYTINNTNNLLSYTTGGATYTHDIPVGNYTAEELKQHLQSQISVLTAVSYDRKANKLDFFSDTASYTFNSASTCLGLFGISVAEQSSTLNALQIHRLTPSGVVNLAGTSSIYIHSNISASCFDARTKGILPILARVPVDTDRNGILHHEPKHPFKSVLQMKSIDYFTFSLEQDDRTLLDLNGEHWSISLQIDFVYEKPFKSHRRMTDKDDTEEENEDE
jgi:hypothetical protein